MREGDIIFSVDGVRVTDKTAKEVHASIEESGRYGRPVYLEVLKGKEVVDVDYKGDVIADYSVELLYTKEKVSLANGQAIMISKGILDDLQTEEEVSYYISYQVASNILNQLWSKAGQISVGAVADLLTLYATGIPTLGAFGKASEGFRAKEFVYRADILSLYLLKSSGVAIDEVPSFWKRMDEKYPKKSAFDLLYYPPTAEERYQELLKDVQEMEIHFQEVR